MKTWTHQSHVMKTLTNPFTKRTQQSSLLQSPRYWSGKPLTENREQLVIFDTSLRDGEQSPGVTLSGFSFSFIFFPWRVFIFFKEDEKVGIARQLSLLGVNVCEAGFPIASEGDFKAVNRIATEVNKFL